MKDNNLGVQIAITRRHSLDDGIISDCEIFSCYVSVKMPSKEEVSKLLQDVKDIINRFEVSDIS